MWGEEMWYLAAFMLAPISFVKFLVNRPLLFCRGVGSGGRWNIHKYDPEGNSGLIGMAPQPIKWVA